MKTSDFDYHLPPELIAQFPVEPRDSSRLMVVDREKQSFAHRTFSDITDYLKKGDLVVWNNTKVFKARLHGELLLDEAVVIPPPNPLLRKEGATRLSPPCEGGDEGVVKHRKILNAPQVEIFLVRPQENKYVWKVLAKPGRRLRLGMKIKFAPDFVGEVMLKESDGTFLIQFQDDDMVVRAKANMYGEVPTPPYIKNSLLEEDRAVDSLLEEGREMLSNVDTNIPRKPPSRGELSNRYQTVYAGPEGSVAAPTAGFHFTPELIEKLKLKGVEFAEVTLHVGLGTFLPVKSDNVEEHKMHDEWVEITAKNADLINQAKREQRRIVAVGTTTVRTLEGVALTSATPPPRCESGHLLFERGGQPVSLSAREGARGEWEPVVLSAFTGDINIFITPGFQFQIVDALITNFHLPKSTLLMLVSAFMGDREFALRCYEEAIGEKYRFYSFGDAMFIE